MQKNQNFPAPSIFSVCKLALCNGLGISAAVISVAVSALVSQQLGWTGAMSTVPYGIQFLVLLMATYPSARLMSRFGRRPIFMAAAISGIAGGLFGTYAVMANNPYLLCLAHACLGVLLANVNFYRFAALELSTPKRRATAMALVMFGGTFAAILGPLISRTPLFIPNSLFGSAYIGISVLCLVIIALLLSTPLARSLPKRKKSDNRIALSQALANPKVRIGMAFAALGYGAMNLLMLAAAITLDGMGCTYNEVSIAIQWHVLAMFLPSLFMGEIIKRFGGMTIAILGGIGLIAAAGITLYDPFSVNLIKISLIVLGVAWNMTYIGGSYIVADNSPTELALDVQAINDLSIGILAMMGAFLPGFILQQFSWSGANIIISGAVLPLVIIASLYLFVTHLAVRKKENPNPI